MDKDLFDGVDKKEFYELLKRSIRAEEMNAQATENISGYLNKLTDNMTQLNDNFSLHCRLADEIKSEIDFVKKDLIKWLKMTLIIIFTLLGGIIVSKALGLDIINIITNVGS